MAQPIDLIRVPPLPARGQAREDALSGHRDRGNIGDLVQPEIGGFAKESLRVMWQDEIARVVTVCLVTPIGIDGAVRAYAAAAFATVEWGSGKLRARAEVDVGQGCQFSLACSWIQASLSVDAVPELTPGVSPKIGVGAFLSVGSSNRETPLTRTLRGDSIGAGASALFPVPPFAKSVEVFCGSDISRHISVDVFGVDVPNPEYTVEFLAGQRMAPVPLSGDANGVRVNNLAGAPTGKVRVIYSLAI